MYDCQMAAYYAHFGRHGGTLQGLHSYVCLLKSCSGPHSSGIGGNKLQQQAVALEPPSVAVPAKDDLFHLYCMILSGNGILD